MYMRVKMCTRLTSMLLAMLMILSMFVFVQLPSQAATTTKAQRSYDIAVVFDNSGSMYGNPGWCRAKYAMEIFASMLDYEDGDRLRIYPMWEVTTDGSTPASGGSYSAIEIKSAKDIDKISNMYTVNPNNTPYEPVTEAQADMMKSSATDKWIIVLSDGEFNQIERGVNVGAIDSATLTDMLLQVSGNGINVQYLGFGNASTLNSNPSKNFYAKSSTDSSLKDDLIGICNAIFQRSELPQNRLSGNSIDLDLSMKNLIVFVQGSNAKVDSLTDSSGKQIKVTLDSGQRKYSTISAKGYEGAPVDKNLAGQVVTFGACPKGKYTLNYSGADSIQMFYEPDVDIKVTLTNSDGQVVDPSQGELTSGEYTVNSMIVDATTGEDVTNHELMGNDVHLVTKVKTTKDSDYKEYPNGSKITFTPDSSTDIVVVGTYLKEYTITSEGNSDLAWLKGIEIIEPSVDFKLTATVQQKKSLFVCSDHENWLPISVSMTVDGAPLTADQMKNVEFAVSADDLALRVEELTDQSGYNVYVGQAADGEYKEPEKEKYSISINATYYDEHGRKNPVTALLEIKIKFADFKMSAEVLQSQSWYTLSDHEEWEPVKVTMTLDGKPLTDKQLKNVTLDIKSDTKLDYYVEEIPGESAYNVYIGYTEKGKYKEPETGEYELKITATYTESGKGTSSSDEVDFEIQSYAKFWRYLKWIIIILVLFILWLLFMLKKVLPKSIVKDHGTLNTISAGDLGDNFVNFKYNRKGKSMSINCAPGVEYDEQCSATLSLKAVDNRFTPSKKRRCAVIKISSPCERVSLGTTKYVKTESGVWVKETQARNVANGKTPPPIDQTLSCNSKFELQRAPGGAVTSTLTCKTKTKK